MCCQRERGDVGGGSKTLTCIKIGLENLQHTQSALMAAATRASNYKVSSFIIRLLLRNRAMICGLPEFVYPKKKIS